MDAILRDVRYSLRILRRAPGFTTTAVLILALAIGVNVAMFSIVNAWFFRPLHFKDPQQLVIALRSDLRRPGETPIFSFYRDYIDWKPAVRSFQGLSAMFWHGFTLTGAGEAEQFNGLAVSSDIFDTLGVQAERGRTFVPSDLNGPPVVVISHQFWQERFGGAPGIIGRVLTLDSKPYQVVGVLPPSFSLRMENQAFEAKVLSLMQPSDPDYAPVSLHPVAVIARLKPGIDMASAQAELFSLQMALDAQHPDIPKGFGVFLTSLQLDNIRFIRSSILLLLGAVGFVLLIACANVAGLLLGRSAHRRSEMALRAALGSSRAQLARQLLVESFVIALLGAAVGLLFAYGGVRAFTAADPFGQLPPDPITISGKPLAFALLLALVNTVMFGMFPAWRISRVDLGTFLRTRGAGSRAGSARNLLVVMEIALSLVMLTGTALVSKALIKLSSAPLGFRPEHVQVVGLTLPGKQFSDYSRLITLYDQVLERVQALPGVQSAALTNVAPMTGSRRTTVTVEGHPPPPPDDTPRFEQQIVTPRYFEVLSTPILRGRAFNDRDAAGAAPVVIVNEALARSEFPGADPIGRHIRLGGKGAWLTIVGVSGTVRTIFYNTVVPQEAMMVYVPARQAGDAGFNFVSQGITLMVKSPRPLSLPEVRAQIDAVNPDVPVGGLRTMERVVFEATGQPRLRTAMMGGFAILALVLAAIGIYSLIAQTAAMRTNEIGIRMALGARDADVLLMVIRQGLTIASVGIVAGIAGSFLLVRSLSAYLYGLSPNDAATYALVTAIVLLVAALAAFLPARRASRVDPLIALRYE